VLAVLGPKACPGREPSAESARSLDFFEVPEREKEEVLAAFAAHKSEVTEGYSE